MPYCRLLEMLSYRFLTFGLFSVAWLALPAGSTQAAALPAADVLAYTVPDALMFQNGEPVKNASDWQRRRTQILDLFAEHVYGKTPKPRGTIRFRSEVLTDRNALDGAAIRKQVAIHITGGAEPRTIHVLLYVPAHARGPVPVFVGLNFEGNQTVSPDEGIALNDVWVRSPATASQTLNKERQHAVHQRAAADTRGKAAARWQVEKILSHGYALATAYCGDIDPDFASGFREGIRPLYLPPGATESAPDDWGTLGAWAWGLSRIADYLQSDPAIDGHRIGLIGHSRLGKAALWAAAQDKRFALVISNESGVGGASLYRAKTGETIEHLNTAFPHWFCLNFHKYTNHPDQVPVDGNLLLSLIAPRPLYVASAEEDHTSNPRAEFYSAVLASRVYELLGQKGLGTNEKPPVNQPVMNTVAYHERSGKHDVTAFDWDQYLKFADMQWKKAGE
jgi:hypothetical protein